MLNSDTYTIPEVASILKKTNNTIYRYIKQGKLKCDNIVISGKKVVRVKELELERFCNKYNISRYISNTSGDTTSDISDSNMSLSVFQKDFLDKIFNAGMITSENKFLKERLETVLSENMDLREKLKSLPDMRDIEKKDKEIIELKDRLLQVEQEKKDIIEECKRQLEEYINKPFWKKLW